MASFLFLEHSRKCFLLLPKKSFEHQKNIAHSAATEFFCQAGRQTDRYNNKVRVTRGENNNNILPTFQKPKEEKEMQIKLPTQAAAAAADAVDADAKLSIDGKKMYPFFFA